MAEPAWLYEDGIGEARAALIAGGAIVAARIERAGTLRAGATLPARLLRALPDTRRALVRLEGGADALLDRMPPRTSEGATIRVTVVREAIPEQGRLRPLTVRLAREDDADTPGPSLHDRIVAEGHPVRILRPHEPDALEAAGWSELLGEAASGLFPFPGGLLRLSLTPAMALFDVDGGGVTNDALAAAGARAAAGVIRRLDIAGSIGIDLPTTGKASRNAAAEAVDAILPQPFERTAVNGFGFLQIVRRRTRPSIAETVQADPIATAALALLRRAERTPGHGRRTLVAAPGVIAWVEQAPDLTALLARRIGAGIVLRGDPALAISGSHVIPEHP